ncbi:MAG TPA: APC family permease [Vicinamibacterales bacterium]|nr:APC family permease [Vicinamibacterales bacterium]
MAAAPSSPTLKRALGLPSLVVFGLAYVAPISVFTTYGVASVISNGRLALAYLVATMAMLLTALSYANLARWFPEAGSVHTYASRVLHPHVGFLAGWAIALDYVMIPVVNVMIAGIFGASLVPALPAWTWVVLWLATVTALNTLGIETTDRSARVVLALEIVALLAFVAVAGWLGHGPVSNPAAVGWSPVFAAGSIVAISFLGFDAVTTLAEEAHEPQRDVPRAVVLTCLVAGGLFIMVCATAYRAHPVAIFDNVDAAGFTVAEAIGGPILAAVIAVGELIGSFAGALAGQAGAARLIFGISRATGLGHGVLDRVHATRRVPTGAVSGLAVAGLLAFVLSLEQVVSLINFGALSGFLVVHAAVVREGLARHPQRTPAVWLQFVVLPLVGAAFVATLLWSLSPLALTVGGVWLAIGAAVLTFRRESWPS